MRGHNERSILIRCLWFNIRHRHLREEDSSLARPAAFVDCSSYVAICSSRYEALFGATCGSGVLICPQIQHQRHGPLTMADEQS